MTTMLALATIESACKFSGAMPMGSVALPITHAEASGRKMSCRSNPSAPCAIWWTVVYAAHPGSPRH